MLISVVRDNSVKELRVYVDGELRNTTDVSGFGSGTLDSWLCFGSDYHSTPLLLDGKIAEVRMWDDVRTGEEIAEYAGKTVTGYPQEIGQPLLGQPGLLSQLIEPLLKFHFQPSETKSSQGPLTVFSIAKSRQQRNLKWNTI